MILTIRDRAVLTLLLAGWLRLPLVQGAVMVESWLTTADGRQQLTPQPSNVFVSRSASPSRIEVDESRTFQTILGLGSSLEGTTCSNFWRLTPPDRDRLMRQVVDPAAGIGMNLMRVCIGTSDFTGDPWYSYCDLPAGETDPDLQHFSIDRDRPYILPILKLARKTNPELRFFASPWSPPGWMKSNGTMIGGYLLPKWYAAYAQYFVRFIQAYEAEGIPIYAITVQNEPGVDRAKEKDPRWHYPSCRWTGEQERDFIRDHLGPALRAARLQTRIWCYDHNYNLTPSGDDPGLAYPRTILTDPNAARFVDGVAFHGYQGQPDAMTRFHEEFPTVPIHFSEGSVFGIGGARDLIERLRNWATSYNAWVLMLDDQGKPNNGPFPATHATVAFNTRTRKSELLLDYWIYGQFMKFIPRGSQRVESRSVGQSLPQVAFRTPEGQRVLVVANPTDQLWRQELRWRDQSTELFLPPQSVGTWRWIAPAP